MVFVGGHRGRICDTGKQGAEAYFRDQPRRRRRRVHGTLWQFAVPMRALGSTSGKAGRRLNLKRASNHATAGRSAFEPADAAAFHLLKVSWAAAIYLESSNRSGASHQKEYPSFKP